MQSVKENYLQPQADNFDWTTTKSKKNLKVKISKRDSETGVRILSQEPYAQELYNFYLKSGVFASDSRVSKDLEAGEIYTAKIVSIDQHNEIAFVQEANTFATIMFPLREIGNFVIGDNVSIMVLKKEKGAFFGSVTKALVPVLKAELAKKAANNEFFTVKIHQLIDGGYYATYKDTIRCFVPGSQAAANIITDFSDYVGKEIPVMIENFDDYNQLFIVSYKKYIAWTVADRVKELHFGQKYKGKLTTDPYDFGIFVEIDNYFTGMIHISDIPKYQQVRKKLKGGDEIDVYIKDISIKKSKKPHEPAKVRVVLTQNPDNIPADKVWWQNFKDTCENQEFDFFYDKGSSKLEIMLPGGQNINLTVDPQVVGSRINNASLVKIFEIDVLSQNIQFDFVD